MCLFLGVTADHEGIHREADLVFPTVACRALLDVLNHIGDMLDGAAIQKQYVGDAGCHLTRRNGITALEDRWMGFLYRLRLARYVGNIVVLSGKREALLG